MTTYCEATPSDSETFGGNEPMTLEERANQIDLVRRTRRAIRNQIEQAIKAAIEEEREACAAHADSVARTSALLPKDDPDRDGPKCARHIERLIRARSS